MAYLGSTSTAPNLPVQMWQPFSPLRSGSTEIGAVSLWQYISTHTAAEMVAVGFFTDGKTLGMKLADIVFTIGSTTYSVSGHSIIAVSTTGVSLSTGAHFSS